MIGQTYLERGTPVTVLARWAPPADTGTASCAACGRIFFCAAGCRGVRCGCAGWTPMPPLLRVRRQGPRNVLIRRGDGTLVVRPFRGLRRVVESLAGEGIASEPRPGEGTRLANGSLWPADAPSPAEPVRTGPTAS